MYGTVRGEETEGNGHHQRPSGNNARLETAMIDSMQAYVSDVVGQGHRTITVANARKFARHFGCSIENLFPKDAERRRRKPNPGSSRTVDG